MDMLSHCFMSVIWGMNYVWQRWITPQTTVWPQTTPRTCSAVTLDIGTKSLNHAHLIRCAVIVVQGWGYLDGYDMQPFYEFYMRHGPCLTGVYHPTDHSMNPNYTPDMLRCYPGYWKNQELESCSSHQWCTGPKMMTHIWIYGYSIPPFHECYIRHVPYLIGLDHPTDHGMTSNCTRIYSAATLDIGTKSLNHDPRKWCSGSRMMMQVWIW